MRFAKLAAGFPSFRSLASLLFVALALAIPISTNAQCTSSGCLDSSFGLGGTVATPLMEWVQGLTQYPSTSANSGKLLAVGRKGTQTATIRFSLNGSVDIPFDDIPGALLKAAAIQPDGKAVVAGNLNNYSKLLLARYDENGHLDPTFGIAGVVAITCKSACDFGAVQLLPDGKILAVGGTSYAVSRFTASGAIGKSFGVSGTYTFPKYWDSPSGIALQVLSPTDTRILVSGSNSAKPTGAFRFGVARLTYNGALDTTFGANGFLIDPVTGFGARPAGVALDYLGRIVLGGWAATSSANTQSTFDFAVARHLPDGRVDTAFGTKGWVTRDVYGARDLAYGMAVQSNGSVLLAGPISSPTSSSSIGGGTARWTQTGALDTTWNASGPKPGTIIDPSIPYIWCMLIQSDGSIVVGGTDDSGSAMLVRYLP